MRRESWIATLCLTLATSALAGDVGIVRLDSRFDELVPLEAKLEKIDEGFIWSEGPVWRPAEGDLLFSDIPRNTIWRWKDGKRTLFLKPAGYTGPSERGGEMGSNGLNLDSKGRLILCQHGDRQVARLESDGSFTVLASRHEGKRFNSPNDLVFKSNGDLYFTDPPYGLEGLNADPAKEIPFNGVYRLSVDGTVTLLTKEMTFPNGIAFSPDEKTLYVAQSDPSKAIWKAFPVSKDGSLGRGRLFADATATIGKKPGLPDGMCVDIHGNLFATGPGGVWVFAPDGTHLGSLETGQRTANCCFGEDGSTLFVTAHMFLFRIETATTGLGYGK